MQHDSEHQRYNKKLLLLIIVLTSLVNPFLGAAVNLALPDIAEEFSMNVMTMNWVAMAFLLSSAIFLVPLGKVADIIGRTKVFITGNIILTIASFLCALSVSGAMLIIFRIIQGLGSAMIFGTGIALVTSAFPSKERGMAIGISVGAVYVGLSIAPLLGGILTHAFGWRSLFYVTIPVGLTIIITTLLSIKADWAEAKHEKFDYSGALVYMLAVSALMYGFSKLPDVKAIVLTAVGIIGFIFFIYIEMKATYPVLNIHLFRNNKTFAFSNLAALINYAATFAISIILSYYLQYIKGLSAKDAGLLMVTQPVTMTVFAIFAGILSDKYDSRIIASLGMAIIVVGLIFLTFLTKITTNGYIIGSLMVLGMGFGLFSSPNTNSVMSSVEKKYLGVASATVGTMRLTGQMFSMGIATLVIHFFIGDAMITPSNYNLFMGSIRVIFLLFSILCFFGVFASLARGKNIVL